MKTFTGLLLLLPLGACAFPTTVQRIGTEYNGAVAGTTNEFVLQNILRAKELQPLHYTALSRITGSFTIGGSGGFNAAVKGIGTTDGTSQMTTNQTTNMAGTAGSSSSAVNTVVNGVTSMVAGGGNTYTPSVGGTFATGPSFDISILNDQKFVQGITTGVPFGIVDNLIAQGFDAELVLRLLVNRVTFKLAEDDPAFQVRQKGQVILTIDSPASGRNARVIATMLACFTLPKTTDTAPGKIISTVDRFTQDGKGNVRPLDLKDLALLDGKQFDVDKPIGAAGDDVNVHIIRPGNKEVVAKLEPRRVMSDFAPGAARPVLPSPRAALPGECYTPHSLTDAATALQVQEAGKFPKQPSEDPIFTAAGVIYVPADKDGFPIPVKADIEVAFRSTEGVIKHVGDYLRASESKTERALTYQLRDKPLFSLEKGDAPRAFAATSMFGQRYSVPNDDQGRQDMQVIAIIEQLINLQRSADVAPQTVPVRVIPGG